MKQYTELTGEEIVINTPEYEAKLKDLTLKDIELIKESDGLWYWVIKCPLCDNGSYYPDRIEANGNLVELTEECKFCDSDCHVGLMIQSCEKYPEDIKKMGMDYLWDIMHDNKIRESVQEDINEYTEEKQHENISGSNLDSVNDELQ